MDVNPEMIAAAEARVPARRGPEPRLLPRRHPRERLDGEFDLVNAARVLQWIPDAGAALAAMARAARPGGA